ncbi:GNAT family N-acetyltransferase [Streptococcus sp. NLN64]|uniref:GNAT family N-acetyltransferase n=1 Tax=Streptococcus sp. NLN64 TaxID=2822799 RepID=UPI0018CAE297|nr:GNAT family N-acetyltransferase [Streptococcus sp. NLN64]
MMIRLAAMADLDRLYEIEVQNFGQKEALPRETLAVHIQNIKTSFLVYEKENRILAYIEGPVVPERTLVDRNFYEAKDFSEKTGGYISITSLSVAPEAQKRGLATILLDELKQVAIQDGREGINLTCHDYLIGFYEKQGFKLLGPSSSTYAGEKWFDMLWENSR